MSAARSPRSGRAPRTDPLAWRRTEPGPLMLLKGPEDYVARWVTDRVTAALRDAPLSGIRQPAHPGRPLSPRWGRTL